MDNTKIVEWILRIAVAGEFIGHGVFALQGKKDWIGWFAKFGVSDPGTAGQLLFLVGIMDIALAILILIKPVRIALLWMTFWGFWTALLRPIVGMPVWDFVERWANWGAPLALLFLQGWPSGIKEWIRDGAVKTAMVIILILGFSLAAVNNVDAHAETNDKTGMPMMSGMMEMMHGNLNKNRGVNCGSLNDAQMLERGEDMMEQMMGRENHEKIEEEMERVSIEAHDKIHTMMGMWATGCVGNENLNAMMDLYGVSDRMKTLEQEAQNQVGWPIVILGAVVGAVGGLAGSRLFRKPQ